MSKGSNTTLACTFCAIANGGAEAHIVFKDSNTIGFLDRRPVFRGHCLLVPRLHHETLSDLPQELVEPLFTNAQTLAQAVENGLEVDGTFVAINNRVSQSVPHLHIHVVPRRKGDGLRGFFWPRTKYSNEAEAAEFANAIRNAIRERK